MIAAAPPSLFEPSQGTALSQSADWLTQIVSSSLAATLCVIAIAFVGLMLMTGRLVVRDAVRVVLGCFVLLGAPAIATALLKLTDVAAEPQQPAIIAAQTPPPAPLPPSNYDPYAGASLRPE